MATDFNEEKQVGGTRRGDPESCLRRQNQVLRELALSQRFATGDLALALREISEAAARTLEVERVNIWLYDEANAGMCCIEQYEQGTGRHSEGEVLRAADYPHYFKALEEARLIAIPEVRNDPRMQELLEPYLQPHRITALLDAPIRLKGRMMGVICHEHVGSPRQWLAEEQYFAGSMADFVALALETAERKQAEEGIKRYAARLKILHELDQAILKAQSPEVIAQNALGYIRQLVSCQRVAVTLYDIMTQELVVLAVSTEGESQIKAGRRESIEPYLGQVKALRSGAPFVPLRPWPHIETTQTLYTEGMRSGVSLPLLAQGVLIGTLNLWRRDEEAFSPEDLELAQEVADSLAIALQQARLLAETQRRVAELAGLHELSQALGRVTDVRETFGVLAEKLARLVGAQMAMVLLLDPASGEMQAQAPGYGVDEDILATFRYPAPPAREIQDFQHYPPFKANSPAEIPFLFNGSSQTIKPESMLIVPMWVERRVIGQVAVGNKPGGFSEDDVRLLQVFANQAATIIQNARLFEAETQRRYEAEALQETAALLNTTLNLEEVLDRILTNVGRVVPHDAANIMLIKGGVARLACSRGYEQYGLAEMVQGLCFAVAETANLRQIVETKQPVVIADTEEDPDWIRSWVRSYIGAPLRIKGEVAGFLNLDSLTPGFFAASHAERLQVFADQAAVAVENARLYTESEQRAYRLQTLHEIDHAILAAVSPESIGQAALGRIRALVPCERASLILFDFEAEQATIFAVSAQEDVPTDAGTQVPLSHFPPMEALAQGQHEMVEDLADLPQRSPLQERRWREEGLRAYLNLPLLCQDELIGSLNLATTRPGAWPDSSIQIAREVADQLAIAIYQGRLRKQVNHYAEALERRVADRTRELSAIYDVTAVTSESLSLEVMLARSLARILEAMGSQAGAIHLLNGEGERAELAIQQGMPPHWVAQMKGLSREREPLRSVLQQGDPLIVADGSGDPRTDHLLDAATQIYAGAPMRARGRILGILSIFRERGQPSFKIEEVALLTSIADQVGVVVESARLRRQAEQTAVMEERARLARDLHDSVTQLLYSVNLFAATGLEASRLGNNAQVQRCLTELREITQQALKEMRLLVYQLRPSALEHEGLIGALQQRLEAVEGRAGVKARLLAHKMAELPGAVEEALYHITQEALNNILKHAQASSVVVEIQIEAGQLELEIRDDGLGFEPEAATGGGGLGLISMWERAEQLGGRVTILSKAGEGTKIRVCIPVA